MTPQDMKMHDSFKKCARSCKQSKKLLLSINQASNLFVLQIESRTKRGLNRISVSSTAVVPDHYQYAEHKAGHSYFGAVSLNNGVRSNLSSM